MSNSKNTSLYFDEENQQLIYINTFKEYMDVTFLGPNDLLNNSYKLNNKGKIISIKQSSDQSIIAIQRSKNTIEFVNTSSDGTHAISLYEEYSQASKKESYAQLLGFLWCSSHQICFVTTQGFELYQVYPRQRSLKFLKSYTCERVHWFSYLGHPHNILLLCTNLGVNVLRPFVIKENSFVKISKIQHYHTVNPYAKLQERDVTLVSIYGEPYVMIIGNRATVNPEGMIDSDLTVPSTCPTFVYLYKILEEDKSCQLSDILLLGTWATSGLLAINIVDNVIVLHHQISKTSMTFDIRLINRPHPPNSHVTDEFLDLAIQPTYIIPNKIALHRPVVDATSIVPPSSGQSDQEHTKTRAPQNDDANRPNSLECPELYSKDWSIFQPDIIVDTRAGRIWRLTLCLQSMKDMFEHKEIYVRFLINRLNPHYALASFLTQCMGPKEPPPLDSSFRDIRIIFDIIHRFCSLSSTSKTISRSITNVSPIGQSKKKRHSSHSLRLLATSHNAPEEKGSNGSFLDVDKHTIQPFDLDILFTKVWQDILSDLSHDRANVGSEPESFPDPKVLLAFALIYIHSCTLHNVALPTDFPHTLCRFMVTRGFKSQLRHLLSNGAIPLDYYLKQELKNLSIPLKFSERIQPAQPETQSATDLLEG